MSAQDPTARFTDRAGDYVLYRPGYPEAAADAILRGLGEPSKLAAADIGAGTGISSRLLATRGVRVFAVEPNAAMRAAAEPHALVRWVDGRAEATSLSEASVNVVLVAQAYHWFRMAEAVAEFYRILVPGGRLAVMWNSRDRRDPLTAAYTAAIREVGGEGPEERMDFEPKWVTRGGLFEPPAAEEFANEQCLDRAGLLGRATSASYVPKQGPEFERLGARLGEIFELHADLAGLVRMKYVTRLLTTRRTAPPA